MAATRSTVISIRLPPESGKRLKRMASRHGWTPSDASAKLVEEGLRRTEFAFVDFRDSPAGRQACIQGSSLAVWEVMLVLRSYEGEVATVAKHFGWPIGKRPLFMMQKHFRQRSMRRSPITTRPISRL
jgi:hypothetical protein